MHINNRARGTTVPLQTLVWARLNIWSKSKAKVKFQKMSSRLKSYIHTKYRDQKDLKQKLTNTLMQVDINP